MIGDSVPVLYYHRVGAPDGVHLSISTSDFEKQLLSLKNAGYQTISVSELVNFIQGRSRLSARSICITFDDGLIDNYLFAHPLLKKYNFKAALFMATSLIRPETQTAAAEMKDFNEAHTLARRGDYSHFLSEKELKDMVESRVWEVYSHSHFHNQVFTSPEKTGVYPDTDRHWGIISAWGKSLAKGSWPVYTRGAGLVNRAWKPTGSEVRELDSLQPNLVQETEEEFQARIEADLKISFEIMNRISPSANPVICWPWGKADENLENAARKNGFIAALRTDTGANMAGMNPMRIHRFAVKKSDLLRFRLGIELRRHSFLAKLYSLFRN